MDFVKDVVYWCVANYIEILATVTGIIYLIFSVYGDVKLWIFGLITSLLYVYVFFKAGVYADMGINIYYVFVSVYGWGHWSKKGNVQKKELPIARISFLQSMVLVVITALIFLIIYFVLNRYTNSDIALFDSITTAASITATWMLARKIIEHWLIWIMIDAISVGLYIYKGLYPTVVLFVVYTIFAIVGYFTWKKEWLKTV